MKPVAIIAIRGGKLVKTDLAEIEAQLMGQGITDEEHEAHKAICEAYGVVVITSGKVGFWAYQFPGEPAMGMFASKRRAYRFAAERACRRFK